MQFVRLNQSPNRTFLSGRSGRARGEGEVSAGTESGFVTASLSVDWAYASLMQCYERYASEPWDPVRKVRVSRKASRYPFVNLLAANEDFLLEESL